MVFRLSSPVFKADEPIPAKYTCDGADVSPPLAWDETPAGVKSFALIVDDPDAPSGVFTHWVLFNMPAEARQLPEGIPIEKQLANGSLQGRTDFRKTGWGGPCPPRGPVHHYRFILYALDGPVDLKPGATKKQLIEAMKGHVLAEAQLVGTYKR